MQNKIALSIILAFIGLGLTFAITQKRDLENYKIESYAPDQHFEKEWRNIQSKIDSNLPKSALLLINDVLEKSTHGIPNIQIIKGDVVVAHQHQIVVRGHVFFDPLSQG